MMGHSIFTKLFPRPHYQLGSVFGGPCPDMLKHFLKRRRTWAGLCGRRAHDLTHVLAERASKPLHLPSPSINTAQVCSSRGFLSFSHTFALTAHNSPSFLSGTPPDLGIGGASPDSPPAPSDLCLWLQEPRRSTFHLQVPDARAPSPEVVALRLTKFGYINWRRLWETRKKTTPPEGEVYSGDGKNSHDSTPSFGGREPRNSPTQLHTRIGLFFGEPFLLVLLHRREELFYLPRRWRHPCR
ncbi:cell synthase-like protein, cell wall biosynthesis [Dorcoceras hygrometricum]|uniref:Cell synthase-like protein, cell wall biosynthesis n=1 Tax=Dorcoceras hygrometricum TaxID=472368 RepID=A0A2Z7BV48_9LAMI|nr:cell synthase-like protein, cell wall biosynthesis [Dorcoceras hygrometricum]